MTQKKRKKGSSGHGGIIVAGITAAAAAAAGAYFLYGSQEAKQNRKKVKSWVLRAKADVLEHLEKAKEMSEADFQKAVSKIADRYAGLKSLSTSEVKQFQREMNKSWKELVEHGVIKIPKLLTTKAPAKKTTAKKNTAAKKSVKKA